MTNQRKNLKAKIVIFFACVSMILIFVTCIVQTFVLNSLNNKLEHTNTLNAQKLAEIKQVDDETLFLSTEEAKEEYFHAKGETKTDETICQ